MRQMVKGEVAGPFLALELPVFWIAAFLLASFLTPFNRYLREWYPKEDLNPVVFLVVGAVFAVIGFVIDQQTKRSRRIIYFVLKRFARTVLTGDL